MPSDTGLQTASAYSDNASSSHESNAEHSKNNELLDSLRRILADQSHLFACGGDIPIRELKVPAEASGHFELPLLASERKESDPITIRWDLNGTADSCAKSSLPPAQGAETGLDRLLQQCRPATFGRGGQDIYDEIYRKAVQIDPATFCTTFDPYSAGIIDARSVRAELYKLNGGHLKVRHKGQEMTFDWSANRENTTDHAKIRWAAFYSDCEHEVLEVISGHRLTLTYNLYAVRGAGRLTGVSPTLNPAYLPLCQALKGILSQDPFNGRGGKMGFWCSHAYAYNHTMETPLPATLKGVDAVLWESFQTLNLDPKIAPVIRMSEDTREMFSEWYDDPERHIYPWSIRLRDKLPSTMPSEFIIGYKFGVHIDREYQTESIEEYHDAYQRWGSYSREPVHWLTKPIESELQLVYTAYGNQAIAEAMYSYCAILVDVPPYK
ncbi:uncharacterized protein ColSpa_00862 [Colletotrichum spaethianum]|uniref:Uncharacterized protein n=1 Tax=Colletotrichum spaethianum TaxID=700344 RepID=A0AA37L2V5_9PEZI|nr:uncharacterized protein ColSpa_00862 [Colletotrichum spaethianum]GKT40681.1 hypothetical protein ColSpa_00862 [Colletotrichum spaethianum]